MRTILKDEKANVIGPVVGVLITIVVAVLIFYNIAGSIDTTSVDADIGNVNQTDSANATDSVLDQANTVFTILPIVAVVIVAFLILSVVSRL